MRFELTTPTLASCPGYPSELRPNSPHMENINKNSNPISTSFN